MNPPQLGALPRFDDVRSCAYSYLELLDQAAERFNSRDVGPPRSRPGTRVDTISPGIILTPLAKDELTGPRGEGYRRMIELCPAGRGDTPDEVGTVGALLMGPDGAFIAGSDFLMDGSVTAAYRFGELAP